MQMNKWTNECMLTQQPNRNIMLITNAVNPCINYHLTCTVQPSVSQTCIWKWPPVPSTTPWFWGKWAVLPLPLLVTALLTSHQSGSCSLAPSWHIHRQSKPGLAGNCILQSCASPGTTLLWADGTAANGREEYGPRCKRMNKEHREICNETFEWQNVLKAGYHGMKTGAPWWWQALLKK